MQLNETSPMDRERGKNKGGESGLLPHESTLVRRGDLVRANDLKHVQGSKRWIWLFTTNRKRDSSYSGSDYETYESQEENPLARTKCYRPMTDAELLPLVERNQIPPVCPMQTIYHGANALDFCLKRLFASAKDSRSNKRTLTTVVELDCDENFVDRLLAQQCSHVEPFEDDDRPNNSNAQHTEDFMDEANLVTTHSLGYRACKTLELLNEALERGEIQWKIICAKRPKPRKVG